MTIVGNNIQYNKPIFQAHNYYGGNLPLKSTNHVSFGSGAAISPVLAKTLDSFTNMGQLKTNTVRAAGKALLSPLVVLWNPFFNKEQDEKSRRYSAALLPVEAGLTFLATTAMNLAAGLSIDKLAKNGKLGDFYNPAKNALNQKHLNIFKDRAFFALTLLMAPLISVTANKIFPVMVNKLFPGFLENKKNDDED